MADAESMPEQRPEGPMRLLRRVGATQKNVNPDRVLRRIRQSTIVGIVILALLNVLDAITTHLLVAHATAGAVEANPLAGALLANGSLLYVKLAIVAVLGLAALKDRPRLGFLVGTWLVTGLYAAAVLSNLLLLRLVQ